MKRNRTLIAAVIALALSNSASAIDNDAGDYTALPPGTNLFLAYYQYATRDAIYTKGTRLAGEPKLDSHVGILRYVGYRDIAGYLMGPEVILPFGKLRAGRDISGLGSTTSVGDVILGLPIWFNRPEDKSHTGVTFNLFLPTGDYDRNDPLSLGENRVKALVQVGTAQPISDKLTLDLLADVQFHGTNDDFGPRGQRLKTKPLFEYQGFLRYAIAPGADLRVGIQHIRGGENEIDGAMQGDRQQLTKVQFGGAMFVTPTQQIIVTYGKDVSVRTGFKEDHRLNFRFLQVF